MKKIFVCSPLRGNIKQNIVLAEAYCRMIALMGMIPIAPHAYFTRFLDDDIEMERELGMSMGMELLLGCDELWYFGEPSAGMKTEMAEAKGLNIPVLDGWTVYKMRQFNISAKDILAIYPNTGIDVSSFRLDM